MDPSTSPERPSKRQRARKACLPCRKRKRKCDANYPCSMCTSYGYNCQYPPDESPTAQFVDPPQSVEKRLRGTPSEGHSPHITTKPDRDDEKELERSGSPDAVDRGLLDPFKERYMGIHSAVAFPRALGIDLQSSNPPRVHSFAWNCGVRPEEPPDTHQLISAIVSQEEYEQYTAVYLAVVHPVFNIICPNIFRATADPHFTTTAPKPRDFNAVLAGVLALGSFFSGDKKCPNEHLLVSHAKGILEDPVFVRVPGLYQVLGNVLRTIYLRATTRPHVSWLASCTAFHCAEATGLHREIDRGVVLTSDQVSLEYNTAKPPSDASRNSVKSSFARRKEGSDVIRRLFWCAWALNRIISYEYGRSWVQLNGITTKLPQEEEGDYTYWLIQLAHIIPTVQGRPPQSHSAAANTRANTAEILLKALSRLDEIPSTHPFIVLSKTDIALSIYRRLRLLSIAPQSLTTQIISVGTASLKASLELIEKRHFWWQTVCSIFQYLCVLLALDNTRSLREVKPALDTLEKIYGILGTHVSCEAVNTARLLVRDSRRKKRRDLLLLDGVGAEDDEGGNGNENEGGAAARGGMGFGAGRSSIGSSSGEVGDVRMGQINGRSGSGSYNDGFGNGFGEAGVGATTGMGMQWNWQLDEIDWDALLDPGFGFLPQDLGAF